MSLVRNQQLFSIGTSASSAASRRRSSNSNKSSLNRTYYIQTPSNNSSISSCDSATSKTTSFIESDLLETNIKEIEYTLLGLMDNEAAANRNSQRLASISSGNLQLNLHRKN